MKHNLIDLLNGFYDLDIQNHLDPASSFLFITLIRKFNSTKNKQNGEYFPESLPIYNNELNHLTGMELRSLRNARTRLTGFRLIPEDETTWLVRYETRGTKESGVYSINYELLEGFDLGKFGNGNYPNEPIRENLVTKNADLPPKNDPISANNVLLSETKQNITKLSLSNTPNSLSPDKWKYEGWREHFDIGKKLIENQYQFFFTNTMKGNISNEQYRMIAFIGKSGDKAIPVISEKASKAKDPINIIAWAYEELSGNGKKPYQQNEATPYKDNEKKLAEDRAIHEKKLKGEYYE